ncbi:hypothetical protein F2Q69_00001066 [Brassica cretica]|uniref:Fatty acid hydroxylase domain-containing protein n=1 Tax=Brassica cretica TaxID=69181 RepID=A0A8S9NT52_BRACR|nr:hypothetical protein F2Q69_00001066 [Brassica cretica]
MTTLSAWPWENYGNLKYLLYAPLAAQVMYSLAYEEDYSRAFWCLNILIICGLKGLVHVLWSTYNNMIFLTRTLRINPKGVDFKQIDHEWNWDNYILLQAILASMVCYMSTPSMMIISTIPLWNTKGLIVLLVLHVTFSEPLYYFLHRSVHRNNYLFTNYHSLHHSSPVPNPMTEQSWAPEGTHFHQFVVPPILNFRRKCTYGDLAAMRLPKDVQGVGTCEYTMERGVVHACHAGGLVHMLQGWEHHEVGAIDVDRIDIVWEAAMRNGLSSVSSLTNNATLLESLMLCVVAGLPLIGSCLLGVGSISLIYGYAITFDFLRCLGHCNVEIFSHKLFETLPILRYLIYTPTYHSLHHQDMETNFCLFMPIFDVLGNTLNPNSWELQKKIRLAAETAILRADKLGVKVISLAALNKNEALNGGGTLFVNKHPDLKVRVVHGNTLTAAVILNEIPKDVKEVFLTGATSKLGRAIALYLCRRGVRVLMLTLSVERFQKIQKEAPSKFQKYLVQVTKYNSAQHCKSWAPAGTHFHQFVVPPILKFRRNCTYDELAAMRLPKDVQGLGTCEYTMDRGVVHACHAGGLVHMLEGWEHHEVGAVDVDRIDLVWEAAMRHGLSSVSSLTD